MAEHGDDVVGVLTTDHREVEQMFAELNELRDLGGKVTAVKKIAPTRPHPAAPDTPPANRLLAPGAGLIDRIRDTLTGRGKD